MKHWTSWPWGEGNEDFNGGTCAALTVGAGVALGLLIAFLTGRI